MYMDGTLINKILLKNTPCTREVILVVQFSHNLYVLNRVRKPQSFVHLFTHLSSPSPLYDIYYQHISEILFNHLPFLNIT